MHFGSFCSVLFERVYIGFGVEFVTYGKVVIMEVTNRQCPVALLVLYYVTLCIFFFGDKCVKYIKVFDCKNRNQCSVGRLVQCYVANCILIFCV